MHTCPRCLPTDPAFAATTGSCPRCGEGLVAWPGTYQPEPAPLAEGGFARVFLARDAEGREAVLKLPRAAAPERAGIARLALAAEAETLAGLPARPGLPALLERVELASADGPLVAVVMTRLPGAPLSSLLERGLPPWTLLEIARQLAALLAALAEAPGGALAHLDLKPDNVLVALDEGGPTVGLIDLGSARPPAGARGLAQAWAAPELRLAKDQALPLATAADIWSLGLLLHTGITGRHPVDPEGDPPSDPLPLPDLWRLPAALQPLVAACLDPDPARRPSARALAQALAAVEAPRAPSLPLADPSRWRVERVALDGASALVIDGALAEGGAETPFDAAALAEGLAPWLADRCTPDPDTRWTPRVDLGTRGPALGWGQDLLCLLGLEGHESSIELLRHAPSGLALAPDDEELLRWQERSGAADPEEALDRLLGAPEDAWEILAKIDLVPGRLVVFPGLALHRRARAAHGGVTLEFSLSLAE